MGKKVKKATVSIKTEEEPQEKPKERTLTFSSAIPMDSDIEEGAEDYGPEDYGSEGDGGSDGGDSGDSDGSDDGMMFSDEECVSVHEENKPTDDRDPEERRKERRIEKLEKRIKALQKKKDKMSITKRDGKYERRTTDIKNKHKRQEVVLRRRMEKNAVAKLDSL